MTLITFILHSYSRRNIMNVSTQADLLQERKMDVRTFVSKGKVTNNIKNNMVVINDHFTVRQ